MPANIACLFISDQNSQLLGSFWGKNVSAAKLDDQLCFALYSASSHMTAIYRPLLEPLDLTYTQFIVLMALWEEDGISISELASRAGLTKATMTPLLKRLEQKDLIRREMSATSERQKQIILTPHGREISTQSKAITTQAFCETGLSETEARQMIDLCNKLVK